MVDKVNPTIQLTAVNEICVLASSETITKQLMMNWTKKIYLTFSVMKTNVKFKMFYR